MFKLAPQRAEHGDLLHVVPHELQGNIAPPWASAWAAKNFCSGANVPNVWKVCVLQSLDILGLKRRSHLQRGSNL